MDIEAYSRLWQQTMMRLLHIGVRLIPPNCQQRSGVLPSHAFIYVTRGKGTIKLAGSVHEVERHYVLHGSKGERIEFEPESQLEYYFMEYMPMGEANEGIHLAFGFMPLSPLVLYELLEDMHAGWSRLQSFQYLRNMSQLYEWVAEVLQQFHQARQPAPSQRVEQAVGYMKRHYAEPLLLEHIASVAGCSVRYLNRLFRTHLVTSPMQVLIGIRMERARELLLASDAPLQEIAELTGYASGYSLSRHFKKVYGVPPQHYREQRPEAQQVGAGSHEWLAKELCRGAEAARDERAGVGSGWTCAAAHTVRRRRVHTSMGEISVPYAPERIVVDWQLGSLLALDVTPLGSPHSLVANSRLLHSYMSGECQDIGDHNLIAMERVLELEPDLIITSSLYNYASYSRIAPTVLYRGCDYGPAAEQIRVLGHILNREGQAERWLTHYEGRSRQLMEKVDKAIPKGKTFTVIDPNWGKEMIIVGNTEHRGGKAIFELLGRRPNRVLARELAAGQEVLVVPWEEAERYMGDYVLVMVSKDGSDEARAVNWERWGAARGSQAMTLEWDKYFLSDPFSALLQAEDVLSRFF